VTIPRTRRFSSITQNSCHPISEYLLDHISCHRSLSQDDRHISGTIEYARLDPYIRISSIDNSIYPPIEILYDMRGTRRTRPPRSVRRGSCKRKIDKIKEIESCSLVWYPETYGRESRRDDIWYDISFWQDKGEWPRTEYINQSPGILRYHSRI
jgi:hypothetical protein